MPTRATSITRPRWRVAHVAQETPALDRAGDRLRHRRRHHAAPAGARARRRGSAPTTAHRIGELHAALADADAYTVRSRAERLLHGLGFTHEQMNQPVASFSGGWRMRLNLAQALMCPSDLLLLDEPTNHLDLDAILWVEDWLKRYAGTLLIISHDRDFLDGVVNVVVHIDNTQAETLRRQLLRLRAPARRGGGAGRRHDREAAARARPPASPSSTASRPRPARRARRRAA